MTGKMENCPHLPPKCPDVSTCPDVRTDGQTDGGTDSFFSRTLLKQFISVLKGCYIIHLVADTAARKVTKVKNAVSFLWLWFYGPFKIISPISSRS